MNPSRAITLLSNLTSLSQDILNLLHRLVQSIMFKGSILLLSNSPNSSPNSKDQHSPSQNLYSSQKDVSGFFNVLKYSFEPMKQAHTSIKCASLVLARSFSATPSDDDLPVSNGHYYDHPIPVPSLHSKVGPARVATEPHRVASADDDLIINWRQISLEVKYSIGLVLSFLKKFLETLRKDPVNTLSIKGKEPMFLAGILLAFVALRSAKQAFIHIDDIWSLD
jgi:hypothetical protein